MSVANAYLSAISWLAQQYSNGCWATPTMGVPNVSSSSERHEIYAIGGVLLVVPGKHTWYVLDTFVPYFSQAQSQFVFVVRVSITLNVHVELYL